MPIIVERFSLAIIAYLGLVRSMGQRFLSRMTVRALTYPHQNGRFTPKVTAHTIHATDLEVIGNTDREDGFYVLRICCEDNTLARQVKFSRPTKPGLGECKNPVPKFENCVIVCVRYASDNYVDAERQPMTNPRRKRAKFLDCSSIEVGDGALVEKGTAGEEKREEDRVGENIVEH